MQAATWNWQAFEHSPCQLKKGARLIQQGDRVENMYLLVGGRVKLTRFTADGSTVILHIANGGEMIAEASLFSEKYHCTALIDRDAELLQFPREIILKALTDSNDSALALLQLMASQVRDLRGLLEIRNIRSAQARILAYLHSIANIEDEVTLPASRRDIAYKLGLAPETFYRELGKLVAEHRLRLLNENTLLITG